MNPIILFYSIVLLKADHVSSNPTEDCAALSEEASKLFSNKSYRKAYDSYAQAIKVCEANSEQNKETTKLNYYKRAISSMSMALFSSSIEDLNKCILIDPQFVNARIQRAKLNLKKGDYDQVEVDVKYCQENENNLNSGQLERLKQDLTEAKKLHAELSESTTKENNLETQQSILNRLLELAPQVIEYRKNRAFVNFKLNNIQKGLFDLNKILKFESVDNNLIIQLSKIYYFVENNRQKSMQLIKDFIKRDVENKEFISHLRLLKNLEKDITKLDTFVNKKSWTKAKELLYGVSSDNTENLDSNIKDAKGLKHIIEDHKQDLMVSVELPSSANFKIFETLSKAECIISSRLKRKLEDGPQVIDICTVAIEANNNQDAKLFATRAEVYQRLEEYEKSVNDYQQAYELEQHNSIYKKALKQAKLELKKSKQKDYYKILGVKRHVSKKDLKKAYNKQARLWHPDRYRGDLSPQQVQDKMSEINQAYEVLSNDELRQQFDNGQDPFDPTQGQHSGGGHGDFFHGQHPFAHFFQGGGGGSSFHFEF